MGGKLCVKEISVGMLGTCCYLVWREGGSECVVIDPGAEPERIRKAAQGKRIAAIFLTHGHFDHIAGVGDLMEKDTELVVHRLDAQMLQDPALNVSWMVGQKITAPEATVTVREGDKLNYADVEFTVLHTPGHTPGCVCYQTENVLFTGDTMFHDGWGRTDLPGGSDTELSRSLQRLYPLARQYTVYPGHGG